MIDRKMKLGTDEGKRNRKKDRIGDGGIERWHIEL